MASATPGLEMSSRPVPPLRLTFVIHALNSGGAERTLAGLANHFAEQSAAVTIVTLDSVTTDAFPLAPVIRRVGLGLLRPSRHRGQAVGNSLRRLRALRRAIRAAGAPLVISFTDKMNVATLAACLGTPHRVVIAERSNPQRQTLGRWWERLRRWTYPRAAAVVAQTEAAAAYLRTITGRCPVYVIPNGVAEPVRPDAPRASPADRAARTIVGLGRLSPEKGFDLLIEAFARVAAQHPAWRLVIAGEGPQRSVLEQAVQRRGLAGRVALPGWRAQPETVWEDADLFVLPSRYEGFPNALLEAMAAGVPAVATDCVSGPADIIRPEVDGLLVPPEDVAALAEALARLMADDALRQRLGATAVSVATRFSRAAFFRRWEQVLSEVLPRG